MKRSLLVSAALVFALGVTGCSSLTHSSSSDYGRSSASPRKNTVALSITVNGTDQPDPAQWAALVAMLEPELKAKGWVLVHNLSAASQILRVNFIPDPTLPNNGRAMIVGLMPNPRNAIASTTAFSSSYPSVFSSSFSSGRLYDPYSDFGYYNSFRNDSAFHTPPAVIITPPVNIPHCPPDLRDRPSHRSGGSNNGSNYRDNPSWSNDNSPSFREPSFSQPTYSAPEPAYTPPPTPAPAMDFTPSSSSAPADHPTSG